MKSLNDLIKIRDEQAKILNMRNEKTGYRIVVGMATCGITAGARPILTALIDEVAKRDLQDVTVSQVGCIGECALEPIVEVYDKSGHRTTYCKVKTKDVEKIIEQHIINGLEVSELLISKYKK